MYWVIDVLCNGVSALTHPALVFVSICEASLSYPCCILCIHPFIIAVLFLDYYRSKVLFVFASFHFTSCDSMFRHDNKESLKCL